LSNAPCPSEARRSRQSALGVRASCPHGFVATTLLATDSPLIPTRRDYSGEAAIPKRGHQEGTLAPPRRQGRFVIDLSAWCIQPWCYPGDLETAWDFHRSVLSAFVSRRR